MEATHMRIVIIAGLLVAGAAGVAQQRKQADIDLQAAIRTESVEGDLNRAIKQYSAIVSKYKADRATVAMALVRMADCYRKMGDAESRKLYEQVLKDYADQKQAVALARAGLGGGPVGRRQTNTVVWGGDGVDDEGTISADGRFLSFTDWSTGDLAIRELATGVNRILTRTGNPRGAPLKDFAEESAISRDGKQVAFSWFNYDTRRYDLHVANLTGEPQPRRLYDDPENEWLEPRDWSPDGKSIVVVISRKDGADRMGLVSVADGSFRVLRSGVWPGNMRVFFSPDGKHIGYDLPEHDSAQPRDLFVLAVDSGQETPVAARRGQDIMMGWSPDGKLLLFGSDRNGSLALWGMPFANGKPEGVPELLKADLGNAEPLGISKTGAFYYGLSSGTPGSTIHLASFDPVGGKLSNIRPLSDDYPESRSNPLWSFDGKQLAHVTQRGGGQRAVSTIVIRSAETYQVIREFPKKITSLAGWAPDGKSLLAVGSHEGRHGAFRIGIDSGEISPLVLDAPGQAPIWSAAWSADGKTLFLVRTSRDRGESTLSRVDVPSGPEHQLLRRPFLGDVFGPSISPDGEYLTVPSVDLASNSRTMLLVPTTGGEPREVMRIPSGAPAEALRNFNVGHALNAPTWAPDSSWFLLRKRARNQPQEIWQAPVNGDAPRKIEATLDSSTASFKLHPDGHRVVYVVTGGGETKLNQIWALENFLPAAK
jgi:Tol biopolymer transport system component